MYPAQYPSLSSDNMTDVDDYTSVAMSALRRLPADLREMLMQAHQWRDVVAWAGVAAVEGWRFGLSARDTYNAAQRYIYQALKAAGYHRPRHSNGYECREFPADLATSEKHDSI